MFTAHLKCIIDTRVCMVRWIIIISCTNNTFTMPTGAVLQSECISDNNLQVGRVNNQLIPMKVADCCLATMTSKHSLCGCSAFLVYSQLKWLLYCILFLPSIYIPRRLSQSSRFCNSAFLCQMWRGEEKARAIKFCTFD